MKSQRLSAFIAVAFLLLIGCNLCENEIIEQTSSPNGKMKAVVFTRDCGATTATYVQVSILKNEMPLPKSAGNTFICHRRGPIPVVKVEWTDEKSLLIKYETSVTTSRMLSAVDGIKILYKTY